ncbi:hypothetical protein GIB67_014640 [Kingdonia uniflora]|uniref:protein-serine/threonine phosphatase n=1 Tax=Kingdonia uniflora TaxID=39325 RepID=A0A7J7NVI3_9MAGN|nr:hypothetical protein GIB67_014640 [Kingdonia uniflora]
MVSSGVMKMVTLTPCWKPSLVDGDRRSREESGRNDGLMWYKDLGHHVNGEFSMAVIQANALLEDMSHLESGPLSSHELGPRGTFVGVYDGHGGPETSRYINDHMFKNLKSTLFLKLALFELNISVTNRKIPIFRWKLDYEILFILSKSLFFFSSVEVYLLDKLMNVQQLDAGLTTEHQEMSAHVIRKAFSVTEEGFLSIVRKQWHNKPQLASVGSCCLVAVICDGLLYVANAGDSRVVLGRSEKATREVKAIQLSTEHNASIESVRDELYALHPNDSQIVVLKHKVWRVKGIIQISRSIGDAYLKKAEFNKAPLLARFRLPETFRKPILNADPSILVQKIYPQDQFLIFASDGLWEHLSNQEAVDIVHHYPRNGIARKLVKAALREAAKKREMRYSDLKKIERGVRRHFHDDITVIVLFLDPYPVNKSTLPSSTISIRASVGVPSDS